mmetsp:Transcript_53497/g.142133  ORF Transcript_53497/g.142133 Transcript_53497/m.142133 type:complete len:464 (+) Transcript_53497:508-1899(+)
MGGVAKCLPCPGIGERVVQLLDPLGHAGNLNDRVRFREGLAARKALCPVDMHQPTTAQTGLRRKSRPQDGDPELDLLAADDPTFNRLAKPRVQHRLRRSHGHPVPPSGLLQRQSTGANEPIRLPGVLVVHSQRHALLRVEEPDHVQVATVVEQLGDPAAVVAPILPAAGPVLLGHRRVALRCVQLGAPPVKDMNPHRNAGPVPIRPRPGVESQHHRGPDPLLRHRHRPQRGHQPRQLLDAPEQDQLLDFHVGQRVLGAAERAGPRAERGRPDGVRGRGSLASASKRGVRGVVERQEVGDELEAGEALQVQALEALGLDANDGGWDAFLQLRIHAPHSHRGVVQPLQAKPLPHRVGHGVHEALPPGGKRRLPVPVPHGGDLPDLHVQQPAGFEPVPAVAEQHELQLSGVSHLFHLAGGTTHSFVPQQPPEHLPPRQTPDQPRLLVESHLPEGMGDILPNPAIHG